MIPLLAAVSIFAAIFALVLALRGADAKMQSRLAALQGQPRSAEPEVAEHLSATQRLLLPMTLAPVQLMRRMMPAAFLERVEMRLVVAGEPMTLNAYLMFQVVSAATWGNSAEK